MDPLFFDYERITLNGGIRPYMDQMRGKNATEVPINKRAYIMYHMVKQKIYDPEFFTILESGLQATND